MLIKKFSKQEKNVFTSIGCEKLKNFIALQHGDGVVDLISKYADFCDHGTLIVETSTVFNIEKQIEEYFNVIVNLKRINDIRRINKFFEAVNSKLPKGGFYICCVETKQLRKIRIFNKYWPIINSIYYFFDFIFKRVFPKILFLKKLYFLLTAGRNRVLSKAEVMGRLYSCGFQIVDEDIIGEHHFFVVRKVKEPAYDYNPSYGPIFKMRRVGKNGKIINVYKLRTMSAYSEYLQEYIFEKNNLREGGKIRNDIRVTRIGKFFRKFWIDEIPMIYNLIRGDLKIVGVRPLSQHYLSLYPDDLKELRLKVKPGLVPPFYADMPKTFNEIVESERKYLLAYQKAPLRTDIKVFIAAFKNIIFKRARSK